MPSTRDRLLDAAEVLLVQSGPRALTLDAAAAAAAVSKGGLLYHFGTKDALVAGLLERLAHRAAADVAAMRADPDGPVAFYLRTAVPGGEVDPLTRTVLAATTLASAGSVPARVALAEVNGAWLAQLVDEVGDAELARVVQLVGDGLWLAATTGSAVGDVGALTALVRSMVAREARARAVGPAQ